MIRRGIVLRRDKDKAVRNRHHWIFSGAVESLPEDFVDGGMYPVLSHEGEALGYAYANSRSAIIARMVGFGPGDPFLALRTSILRALALRHDFFGEGEGTNAYRIINAEGDGLPGLIVDRYDSTLVVQVATLGMEKLKDFVIDTLVAEAAPAAIFEKSNMPSRREEGLEDSQGWLYGESENRIRVFENGHAFCVDLADSQKTGFYLDQREMRKLAGSLAGGRKVLNAFSYTGGFSVYALTGGAARVDSVDASAKAIELSRDNFALNGLPEQGNGFYEADVFEFLRNPPAEYDFVVLDPPAFAKRKADVRQACRGYKDINRLAIRRVAAGGLVFTFSCSHFVDEHLFRQVVFQAAAEASRNVRILMRHRQAPDHPVNIYHPETEYLKGFLLYVD
jgi:23S rRNA (cytosine1962-C5)-methyltransferase